MAEYIERAAAVTVCDKQYKECLRKSDFCGDTVAWNICAGIRAIPAADVAPVRHGYWRPILHVGGKTDYECSCCLGIIADVPDDDEHDLCAWCSMCGAKMDGGDIDEAD